MADLSDLQAAQTVKIVGTDASGVESNPVNADLNGNIKAVDYATSATGSAVPSAASYIGAKQGSNLVGLLVNSNGNLQTVDEADGPVTPGTVATKSQLVGMQYNTAAPAPTNGQQLAMQSTADGRLRVDANFSVLGGQLVPTITNKLRVRYSTTSATVGSAYSTIYTRSGTGLFFGFQADFNSANVRLRLTIDSGQIFEITVADLKLFQFNDTTTTRMQMGGFWATVGNTVDFSVKYAIPYTSSVLLEMQRSDGVNHQMSQYMVILTEDT